MAQRPTAATYGASEQTGQIGDRAYRLVVYRSSSLDRRKAKTLEREMVQARAAAERAATALAAQAFACAAGTVTDKRARPGRLRRDDPAPTHPVSRVQVTGGPRDDAAVQTELARRSTCVLITTLPPPATTRRPCCGSTRARPAWSHGFTS